VNVKNKLSDCMRPLLLGALLLGQGLLAQAEVRLLDRVVAIVDNDVVMQSQLDQRLRDVQQTIAKRGAALPPEHVLTQQVLERLIIESIQLQIGERSGIRITDEELNQALETIAQRNGLSLEQFRQALAQDGLSFADAREQVRREMIISRVRQRRVAERIQVTEQEVQNFLASDLGKMQLSEEYRLANILIPVPDGASPETLQAAARQADELYQQLRQGADFAQLAIARSASETALEGGEMGWRKAAQLPPPFDSMIGALQPGEVTEPVRTPGGFIILKLLEKRGGGGQVREEVHVRHILIKPSEIRSEAEARRLVERLYERIQAGEDFAALAREFSDDTITRSSGGDMGWFLINAWGSAVGNVLNGLADGQLSEPFASEIGWHIIRRLGTREQDVTEENRRNQAREIISRRKAEEEYERFLRQLRSEAYVESRLAAG